MVAGARLKGEQMRFLLAALVLLVCFRIGWDLVVTPRELYSIAQPPRRKVMANPGRTLSALTAFLVVLLACLRPRHVASGSIWLQRGGCTPAEVPKPREVLRKPKPGQVLPPAKGNQPVVDPARAPRMRLSCRAKRWRRTSRRGPLR